MARTFGNLCFIAGVLIAIVVGIAGPSLGPSQIWLTSLLVVMGLIVGLFNVSGKETKDFLLMATALIIASYAGNASDVLIGVQSIGSYLSGVFGAILSFVVPATLIAALRGIWALGSD